VQGLLATRSSGRYIARVLQYLGRVKEEEPADCSNVHVYFCASAPVQIRVAA
jgi:hypothetical protein